MAKKKKAEDKGVANFEDSLAELEQIVHALEDGQIGLADALARYEQGAKLLKECYKQLADAEQRIELLSGVDSDGNACVEEFGGQKSLASGEDSTSPKKTKTPDSVSDGSSEDGDGELF